MKASFCGVVGAIGHYTELLGDMVTSYEDNRTFPIKMQKVCFNGKCLCLKPGKKFLQQCMTSNYLVFSRYAFLSDYLTDLKLHRMK